jgi:cytochrome c1
MKACPRCGETKPATLEHFYARKARGKTGLTSECKACLVRRSMEYEKAHPKKRERVRPTEPGATKVCARCKVEKPATDEHFCRAAKGSKWFQSYCKPCAVEYTADASKHNPKYRLRFRRRNLRRNYGLTVEQYEALYRAQGGVCAICKGVPTGKRARLAVDHDHETGAVRGLLCDHCNRGLGGFRDNPERLRLAAEYVEKHKAAAPSNVVPIRK